MSKEKYGFIYLWRDKGKNRYYIGKHWGTEDDGYVCSSNWMNKSYKKRPQDFKRRVLKRIYTNKIDLLDEEYRWLQMIPQGKIGKRYYNLTRNHFPETFTNTDRRHSNETKQKMRDKALGRAKSEEVKTKIANTLRGRTTRPCSEETRRKISEAKKGRTNGLEGTHNTKATIEKRRLANLGKNKGKPWSEARRLAQIKRNENHDYNK